MNILSVPKSAKFFLHPYFTQKHLTTIHFTPNNTDEASLSQLYVFFLQEPNSMHLNKILRNNEIATYLECSYIDKILNLHFVRIYFLYINEKIHPTVKLSTFNLVITLHLGGSKM